MRRRWLLLNALLIGIAPGTNLQAAANPAQAFRRIGRTNGAAHGTFLGVLHLIRDYQPLGFVQKLLIDHRIGDHRSRHRHGFSFHPTKDYSSMSAEPVMLPGPGA